MLTNRPNCLKKTSTVVTGLSDFHKMIISYLKTTFKKIPPKKIIFRDYEMLEMFNSHYINIEENMTGIPLDISPLYGLQENDGYCVKQIIKKFENHPSIVEIKKNINIVEKITIKEATVSDINTLLKSVNTKKGTGPDNIPSKLVKLSANVIDSHLCNIINKGLQNSSFPDAAKIASVRLIFKKKCRNTIENYRSVSVLNTFSKIYERYIHNSLIPYINKCLSEFVAAYRKCYSSGHVLIRLVENWKKELDNKKYVGAILMDLSKAFDCIPHELLTANMDAYGFNENALTFFFSYLKRRKQSVQINNTHSIF